tara:strand:- start:645 stop:1313 length:669 start_codon:yes stop_codon:yes gene_type:complete
MGIFDIFKTNDDKPTPIYDDADFIAKTGAAIEEGYFYWLESDGGVWRDNADKGYNAEMVARSGILRESGFYYFIGSDGNVYRSDSEKYLELDGVAKRIKAQQQTQEIHKQAQEILKKEIIKLLKEKAVKMPASDIDAHLKHQNVDEIKELCEEMYHNGEISRTGNYRYFILTEEQKKPKKASAPKSEKVDVEKELEKLKGLLDKGLITQEAYDAKMNQLLGL